MVHMSAFLLYFAYEWLFLILKVLGGGHEITCARQVLICTPENELAFA